MKIGLLSITLACDVIFVARQRISNVVYSFFSTVYVATGTVKHCLAIKMTSC